MATVANFDSYAGFMNQLVTNQTPPEASFTREFYRLLFAYYQSNGLYDYINANLKATKTTDQPLKPLRNPAWRVVEFYAAKLFPGTLPGALPIETANDRIIVPIHQLWTWSNFGAQKQKWSRWFAIYGDWFIKVQTKGDPVSACYMTLIRPEYVTDFTVDERGYLTEIRIDIPILDEDGDVVQYHTEVWDKEQGKMWLWLHEAGIDKKLEELPKPVFTATIESLHGDNFIPIVYQPFRDDGGGRCASAYVSQLDKIDEVNRQATRLAQILFRYNRAIWAATNTGADASGRPLPPISFDGIADTNSILTIGDDEILALPAMSALQPLVPPINYADALAVLESQMSELTQDLPELAYYEIRGLGDVTGRAVKFLLDDMISRVEEARGNAETALQRAHQMALTIGQNLGIWSGLGDYYVGDFEHEFGERNILPEDKQETAELIRTLAQAGATIFAAAKAAGMSTKEAEDLAAVDVNFEENIGGR